MTRLTRIRAFVAAAAAINASTAIQWMQPLLMTDLVLRKGFDPAAAGLLISAEAGATAISAIAAAKFVGRAQAQPLALGGIVLACILSFISTGFQDFTGLVVARIAVGLATGMTPMTANVASASVQEPERFFALLSCSNIAFGTLLVAVTPYFPSPYFATFAALIVLVPMLAMMPRSSEHLTLDPVSSANFRGSSTRLITVCISILVAVTITVNMCFALMFGLYGLLGFRAGISSEAINSAIAVSVGAGLIGAGVPVLLGKSRGRAIPFGLALASMSAAILVLTNHPTETAFRIAVCAIVASGYMTIPYVVGLAVALDSSGKGATYISGGVFAAWALSPLAGGLVITHVAIEKIGLGLLVTAIVTVMAYFAVVKMARDYQLGGPSPFAGVI